MPEQELDQMVLRRCRQAIVPAMEAVGLLRLESAGDRRERIHKASRK